jgi:L-lactate dehydrogenase complex protein LldE
MAERKCESIKRSGANTVAAGDLGCLMNIEGTLRRQGDETPRVLHIAEVLAGDDGEWK